MKVAAGSRAQAEEDEYVRLMERMRESHAYIAANELQPFSAARTVRVRNGTRSISDGPAVRGSQSGSVEIRPVVEDELADWMAAADVDVPE